MKKLLSVINVLALMALLLLPTAAMGLTEKIPYDSFIQTEEKEDYSICKRIDAQNLVCLKAKAKLLSTKQVSSNLLETLGMTEWAQDETVLSVFASAFDKMQDIQIKVQYATADENGNQLVLSEKQCLQEINSQRNKAKASGNHEKEQTDGKMKSALLVSYTGKKTIGDQPNTATYFVLATHTWLTPPMNRGKDAFSVCADSEALPFENDEDHAGLLRCKETAIAHSRDVEKVLPAKVKTGAGVSCECYLTPYTNGAGIKYSDFSALLISNYFITDTSNSPKTFRLWTKYAHSWLGLTASIGWDIGLELPGVTLSPVWCTTEYGFKMDVSTGQDY